MTRAWRSLKEDAREDEYESLRVRLRDVERENTRLRSVVAIQRPKRERAEAMLEGLAAWLPKLSNAMKGESCVRLLCVYALLSFS